MASTSNGTAAFSGKAAGYDRFRPGYPASLVWYLAGACELGPGATAVDAGAGTGIFSRALAQTGCRVVAVEPNADMLARAREHLMAGEGALPRQTAPQIELVQAPAEATGLPAASADLVCAAQAFHWFDHAAFRAECARVLKPGGHVALIWNSRVPDAPVTIAAAKAMRELCPAFPGFSGGTGDDPAQFADFFDGPIDHRVFSNDLVYDEDGFIGRNLSASYAPRPGDAAYEAFIERFRAIFARFAVGGTLTMPNVCRLFLGRVSPAASQPVANADRPATAPRIRPMTMDDYDEVHALWLSCPGMGLNDVDDARAGIARLLAHNPTTCLVAEDDAQVEGAAGVMATGMDAARTAGRARRILGVILAGVDGRRAYVYHTAVRPDVQGEGIGRTLVEAELAAISALGISKAALVVFCKNTAGAAFWERMGFRERHDIAYRDRALRELVRIDT